MRFELPEGLSYQAFLARLGGEFVLRPAGGQGAARPQQAVEVSDGGGNTVARLVVDGARSPGPTRLRLEAGQGDGQFCRRVADFMTGRLGCLPVAAPPLTPTMPADEALKQIYAGLLATLKANQAGVVAGADPEHLHDFRVAIRKTRAGLSQFKRVLPDGVQARTRAFFGWLGQITGAARDLDVCALALDGRCGRLPATLSQALAPLRALLQEKLRQSQARLAEALASARYGHGIAAWERFLGKPPVRPAAKGKAGRAVKRLADKKIWKAYRRVLADGGAIDGQSTAAALHELRKRCKKLRYLLEFFADLYPGKALKPLLRHLKSLQAALGAVQDGHVQGGLFRQLGAQLRAGGAPAATLAAVRRLRQQAADEAGAARRQFEHAYQAFTAPAVDDGFRRLFAGKRG